MTNAKIGNIQRLATFLAVAGFKPDTDRSQVTAVVAEERAQVVPDSVQAHPATQKLG